MEWKNIGGREGERERERGREREGGEALEGVEVLWIPRKGERERGRE